MNNSPVRRAAVRVAASAVLLAFAAGGTAWALQPAEPTPAPAQVPTTPTRTMEAVAVELQEQAMILQSLVSSPADLADSAKRDAVRDEAVPAMRRMAELAAEGAAVEPAAAMQLDGMRRQMLSLLVAFGDEQAEGELAGDDAVESQASLVVGRYLAADDEEAAEIQINRLAELAEADPASDAVAEAAMGLTLFARDPDQRRRAEEVITSLEGPLAQMLAEQIRDQQAMEERFVGKPLVLEGPTVDGEDFTTQDWKGKVILVDFWATWCGPCLAEKPRLKALYEQYHEQGFEILGVSNDQSAEDLKQYIAENPDIPWPHLFDADNPGWHAITADFGISGIPTMFLIDRNGVCRTVTAREDLEELLPKLLAEEAEE